MKSWRAPLTVTYLLLFAAAWLLYLPAEARMHHPYRGHHIVPGGAAPLDSFTQPSGAYSFRKLKSTYAGSAIRIRRASDNAELDIGFVGASWDGAAATAHCAATNCFVKTLYDQSGGVFDLTTGGPGAQPALVFNCWGSLPCMQTTVNTQFMGTTSLAPVAPITLSGVAERTSGNQACQMKVAAGGNLLLSGAGLANQWQISGTGNITAAATDGARHALTGVVNGASSVFNVDGTETTGTVTAITTANVWQIAGGATPTVCKFAEFIAWSGYGPTPAERTVLQNNQKSYWGTP